eukprot:scaffold49682_cov53-Cyclotella_meneghiniana.AAC.3
MVDTPSQSEVTQAFIFSRGTLCPPPGAQSQSPEPITKQRRQWKQKRRERMKRSHSDADLSRPTGDTDLTYPWLDCEKPCYGFTAETKDALLSSSTVDGKYVLWFTLDFVFGWYHHDCLLDFCQFTENKNTIIDNRVTLLEFVTEWLAVEEGGRNNNVPSLTTLCAQRIAMEIFQKFVSYIDHHFENSNPSFFNIALFNYIELELANNIGAPVHLHSFVVEEVCLFVIVYLLYIDIRKQTDEPTRRRDLQIPIPKKREPHGFWWDHIGIHLVDAIVKNQGRGALAKAGLLPYCVFIRAKAPKIRLRYSKSSLWCMNFICSMFDTDYHLNIQHPMAESVALIPIISTFEACFIRSGDGYDSKWLENLFEGSIIPWLKNIRIEPIHKELDMLYGSMVRVSSLTGSSTDVHALEPLMGGKSRGRELVQNCIDMADTLNEYGRPSSNNFLYKRDRFVKRIRLTGNFSKVEILRTAMRMNGHGPAVLDFEDCKNLDEECLKLVLKWLHKPKVVRLKGTSINQNSEVLKRLNKDLDIKKKILFVFEPKVVNKEEKLERENRRLLQENASLKRQIDELKSRCGLI